MLKGCGAEVAEAGMDPLSVVPAFDVLEDGCCGLLATAEWAGGTLGLQRGVKALHDGVVVAVADPVHADPSPEGSQTGLVGVAGVLAPVVGVMQQRMAHVAPTNGHCQGSLNQRGLHVVGDRPTHDHAAAQVQDRRQIQPAFGCGDGGDIRYPLLVGKRRMEIPAEQVGGSHGPWAPLAGEGTPVGFDPYQALLPHQAGYSMAPTGQAQPTQGNMDARAPVAATALPMHSSNGFHQHLVGLASRARATLAPGIVAAARYPQDCTHPADRKAASLLSDEGVPHSPSCEKMLMAFFRMSRSWEATASSRFKRRISALAASSVVGSVPGVAPSTRLRCFPLPQQPRRDAQLPLKLCHTLPTGGE